MSRRCDQGVDEGNTLRQYATDVECSKGHPFINRDYLVQQLQVILHGASCIIDCGSQFAQPAGKLRKRNTGGKNFGFALLEERLDPCPARLLTAMGE